MKKEFPLTDQDVFNSFHVSYQRKKVFTFFMTEKKQNFRFIHI